ncbi:MAG: hypothetical protein WCJ97_09875 [Phycisphaerae bacterium]
MWQRLLLSGLILTILCLTACVPEFVNPLVDPAKAKPDPALTKPFAWVKKNDSEQILRFSTDAKGFRVVHLITEKDAKHGIRNLESKAYEVLTVTLGEQNYMHIRAVEVPEQAKNDKAWLLLRYRFADGKLVVELVNFAKVADAVSAGKLTGTVERDDKGDAKSVKVTASTEALVVWLTKNADDKTLWSELGTYTAVPEAK